MKKWLSLVTVLVMLLGIAPAVSALPADLESLAIVGSGLPGIQEWDPADPNGDMTYLEGNTYGIILELPAETQIEFKFAGNDCWGDHDYGGNSNAVVLGKATPLSLRGANFTYCATGAEILRILVVFEDDGNAVMTLQQLDENHIPIDPPETPDQPVTPPLENLKTFSMVGSGIPGVAEWDPADPNGEMTPVGEALYSMTLELKADQKMSFKFTGNGGWNEYNFGCPDFNFSGGTNVPVGTDMALVFMGGNLYYTAAQDETLTFYVDLSEATATGGNATMWVEREAGSMDPPVTPPSPSGSNVLYFENTADWQDVRCYYWADDVTLTVWPGDLAEFVSGTVCKVLVPKEATYVIFSGLAYDAETDMYSRKQTDDLDIPGTGYIYSPAASQWDVYTGDTPIVNPLEGLQSLAIVGTGIPGVAQWDPADPNGDMTLVGEALYSITLELKAGDEMQFMFAGNDAWIDYDFGHTEFSFSGGTAVTAGEDIPLVYMGGDMHYTAAGDVLLTLCVDLSGLAQGGSAILRMEEKAVSQRLPGDISGDGKLNVADTSKLYAHVRGTAPITDPEILACADLTGEGRVNTADVARLYAHVRGTNPL